MCLCLPPQTVHGAAAADGVGPGGRGAHGTQTQLLGGQR